MAEDEEVADVEEEDIYTDEGIEQEGEEDEITEEEEGFMKGYKHGAKLADCAQCKTPIYDKAIEKEYKGEDYFFCSEKCADKFAKKWKKSAKE